MEKLKSFPWATFNAVLAAILTLSLIGYGIKRKFKMRKYTYAVDEATGNPKGKPLTVEICTFGAPKDFSATSTN